VFPKSQSPRLNPLLSVVEPAKTVKLRDQNETIQMRFTNGFKIMYAISKKSPKRVATTATNWEKRSFQIKLMTFPANNMGNFLVSAPFSGKIREVKRKLKTRSMNADSWLTWQKNKSTDEMIAPEANPRTR
jgi:hypothetical protein